MPTSDSPAWRPVTGTLVTTPVAPLSNLAMSLPLVAYNSTACAGKAANPSNPAAAAATNSFFPWPIATSSYWLRRELKCLLHPTLQTLLSPRPMHCQAINRRPAGFYLVAPADPEGGPGFRRRSRDCRGRSGEPIG